MDTIAGHKVSCVDVAVPMVIADAASFGKTGHETMAELEADTEFMTKLRQVWIEAGLKMQLRRRDGKLMTLADLERSETIPKVCIVAAPQHGGHIAVRYFTPQTGHASLAVSGGCCLAAACLLAGTTAHQVAEGVSSPSTSFTDIEVSIENPAGKLDTTVSVKSTAEGIDVRAAAYRRNAQILMRGHVPLYRASAQLVDAMSETRDD